MSEFVVLGSDLIPFLGSGGEEMASPRQAEDLLV
jgi:hypothetical protein